MKVVRSEKWFVVVVVVVVVVVQIKLLVCVAES